MSVIYNSLYSFPTLRYVELAFLVFSLLSIITLFFGIINVFRKRKEGALLCINNSILFACIVFFVCAIDSKSTSKWEEILEITNLQLVVFVYVGLVYVLQELIKCPKFLFPKGQVKINGLLWDTENLCVNGQVFFTWEEAQQAAAGVGKRLPTVEEYERLLALGWHWSKTDKGIWCANGKLFFPATGYPLNRKGLLGRLGKDGYVWTSAPNGSDAYYLGFNSGNAYVSNGSRTYGFPVRCVQEINK